MSKEETRAVSEREKVSIWLEKQIRIWNGAPAAKLVERSGVPRLSSNIKVEDGGGARGPGSSGERKENVQQGGANWTPDNAGSGPSEGMRLKFKDWSDLHNYLLVSMKQGST
ncbi:hypothetical protein OIY81_2650 [Cryptosporidium canis]|uniref:Uncharacterized protein n=1 Tax=Cryptosporidium canis TaxID=195482 RepID=A0ABQ8PBE5_9CRYT|nr:hypothetical protein OIY81_2650 [Cryptosporidium canis]KAJ1614970.1 hypothetical protein OJ252_344 [Cryptosporidium canis]